MRLFIYGTLKRGGSNHTLLAGQQFFGIARTVPGFTLYSLGGYPGMVAKADDCEGVAGEVWLVDMACLSRLDALEGLAEGLYRRAPVRLLPPFTEHEVQTYLYARSISQRRHIGAAWSVG